MKTINATQLKQRLDRQQDLKLLNVLPAEQFQQKHIPGSVNVPFQQAASSTFVDRVRKVVGDKQEEVVVYCADERCNLSPQAAKALEGAGFGKVIDFEGGVDAWERAGYSLGGPHA